MEDFGLREVRQNASELVRRAQAGERLTITVSGRPAAMLVPVSSRTWKRWEEISDIFSEPADPEWEADRELIDGALSDPWERG